MTETAPHADEPETDAEMATLNLQIPKEAYRRVKHAAIDSDLPLKVYVAKLLMQAEPIRSQDETTNS